MDLVKKIVEQIQMDGIITDTEIMLLDQAIASDGAVTPEEIALIDAIATKLSNHELIRDESHKVSLTELDDLLQALWTDPECTDESKQQFAQLIKNTRAKIEHP